MGTSPERAEGGIQCTDSQGKSINIFPLYHKIFSPRYYSMFILKQDIEKIFSLLLMCDDPSPKFSLSPSSAADRYELGQTINIVVLLFSLSYEKTIAILI